MTDAQLVYLDTNAFRDLIEGEPAISAPAQAMFDVLRKRPGLDVTSELTLAEILAPSKGRKLPPHLRRLYLDLLVWGRFVDLQPVSRGVLLETVSLRATKATSSLKLLDAIHLVTAIRSGCRFFVSRDRGIRVPSGMQRVESDPSSVTGIVEALE
jgi:predicted nucleic acid-binding protein